MRDERSASDDIALHIPQITELDFRQQMLADAATMAYNAPWFPPDGRVDFPKSRWPEWYARWIGKEPERFCAYLQRKQDGTFVGEVCWHRMPDAEEWEIGIVVLARYRCRGYGQKGLSLLLERAFLKNTIPRLRNTFEPSRTAARRVHQKAGFTETRSSDGLLRLLLTRNDYLR